MAIYRESYLYTSTVWAELHEPNNLVSVRFAIGSWKVRRLKDDELKAAYDELNINVVSCVGREDIQIEI